MRGGLPLVVPSLLAALVIAACGDDGEGDGDAAADAQGTVCEEVSAPEPKQVDLPPPKRKQPTAEEVVLETSCGEFVVDLDAEDNPKTAASFQYLAEEGVFDGTPFHRVVPGFVIQGGDPEGTGAGGPGFSVTEKPPAATSYTRGTVAMAKTPVEPPGRSGSQFFVVTGADAGLTPDFAVAGEVTEGFEVVEAIESLGQEGSEQPVRPVVIESATAR